MAFCKKMKLGTHAEWLTSCANNLVEAQRVESPELWKYFSNMAHQISQSRPSDLCEFVQSYPTNNALELAPLMVLAWRIVGNEFREDMAIQAKEAIEILCDIDEAENATESFT